MIGVPDENILDPEFEVVSGDRKTRAGELVSTL